MAWTPRIRDNNVMWNGANEISEFENNSRIKINVLPEIKETISDLIKANWDCFTKRGTRRPILGYEFGIDTGDSKPACCLQPRYDVHESKVIITQIEILLHNGHIRHCEGPYDALIFLAANPH